jgi:hypothetical protein
VRRSPSVSSARSSSLRPCCPAPASVSRSLCCRPLFTAFPRSMHSCRPEVQPDRLCMRHRPTGRLQTAGSWLTPISRSTRTSTRWFPSPPGTTQSGVCCRHSKWTGSKRTRLATREPHARRRKKYWHYINGPGRAEGRLRPPLSTTRSGYRRWLHIAKKSAALSGQACASHCMGPIILPEGRSRLTCTKGPLDLPTMRL